MDDPIIREEFHFTLRVQVPPNSIHPALLQAHIYQILQRAGLIVHLDHAILPNSPPGSGH